MIAVSYSNVNRRRTSRNDLNIEGKIVYSSGEKSYEDQVIINNISLSGIQLVFQDNPLLFEFLKQQDSTDEYSLTVTFVCNEQELSFDCFVEWLRIFDVGERNFYILTGLQYVDKEKYKTLLIDLILDFNMEEIYF